MTLKNLSPLDATAYRVLRLAALREQPPAFGTLAQNEEKVPLEFIASRLEASDDAYLIGAWEDDVLAGSIRFSRFEAPNERHRGFIAGFYVEPKWRRRGIARALLNELLVRARSDGELRRLELSVITTQIAAISLYESLGFRIYGTAREAFSAYGQFHDEHLMALSLLPEGKDKLKTAENQPI